MEKNITKKIEEIKNELGNDFYELVGCTECSQEIISNGKEFVVISDNDWNGEYYSDCFLTDFYPRSRIVEVFPKSSERLDVSVVYLETEEDEFEDIGYIVGERHPIIYTM